MGLFALLVLFFPYPDTSVACKYCSLRVFCKGGLSGMDYPPSIFCWCPTCTSTCRLPRKQSNLSCIMVEPVVLSCSHKFCSSCLNLATKKCIVCGAAFFATITVDPLLQEMCDWFRANEALLVSSGDGMQ